MADDKPGRGVDHVDQGGDEDALVDVGGGSERGAGLPPLRAVVAAGGDGQDVPAGVGPGALVAAADPAVMTLLQQLLANNHAIEARLTCVENNQAQPQQQQQQQQQQQ